MSGLPVHHQFLELAQAHINRVTDAIQPSHPLSFPSPPALNISHHQGSCLEAIPPGPASIRNCTPLSCVPSKECFVTPDSRTTPCAQTQDFFYTLPALSWWESCEVVTWLLGTQRPWQCWLHSSTGGYCHRRYGSVRAFSNSSDPVRI